MGKVWLLDLKKMSIFTGIVRIIFTQEIINYRNRKGAVQKYFANPKKYSESISFIQIACEKLVKSRKQFQILISFIASGHDSFM